MTACNIIIQGATGYLITDTGLFWDDGRVAAIRSKVTVLPAIRVAMAVRGVSLDLTTALGRHPWRDLEELLTTFPSMLPKLVKRMQRRYPLMRGRDRWNCTVSLVAYVPAMHRAVGLVIANTADGLPPGYEPFTWQGVQECLSPGVDREAVFDNEADTSCPTRFPIQAGALSIIEAQRRDFWGLNGSPKAHRVGGAAELTRVDAIGVKTQTLRTWPDKVGEKIKL